MGLDTFTECGLISDMQTFKELSLKLSHVNAKLSF